MANSQSKSCTLRTVMQGKGFSVGYKDALKGKPFDPDKYAGDANAQWNYERGRHFAFEFKGDLKAGNRVRIEAVRAFGAAIREKHII